VAENEPVVTIVPENQGEYIGRVLLGMKKSGKVEPGLSVNIKLSSFPYLEYGMLRGVVKSRSLVPEGDSYYVEISFPDRLVTLYGTELSFSQNMQGTAEIETDRLSLLQKIIEPLKYLITKYGRSNNGYLPE
jgi:HlyD family secretion protein